MIDALELPKTGLEAPANRLVIGLAQIDCTVGDIAGNLARMRAARAEAAAFGADLVMFSELFIAGYPPEDLPWGENGHCYNAFALLDKGRIEAIRFKVDLPNYGVFDEKRVFTPGPMPGPVVFKGVRIGIPICEDIWGPDPVECISETGGEILLVPNGSPYWRGKTNERLSVAVARVVESKLPLVYLNQFGGQDELVFDGASFGLNADSVSRDPVRRSKRAMKPITPPVFSVFGIMWTKTVFLASSWDFPAASTPRSVPRWLSMRSGLAGFIA